jgi:hypothetical protein
MAAVAVRFEGTISPEADRSVFNVGDSANPVVAEVVRGLYAAGHEVYVISTFAAVADGLNLVQRFLISENVPFTEVWASFGFPEVDLVIDNKARGIGAKADTALNSILKHLGG